MQLHSFCTPIAMQIFWFALHRQKRNECTMSEYRKNTLRVFKLISHTIKTAKMRVYAALETLYGDQDAKELIDSSFWVEFKAIERRVSDFLVMSISEKIGEREFKEI